MASPFPGMDPYLEDPAIWSGVHAAFLAGLFERLGPAVRPKYAVRYEERVYVTNEEDPGYRQIVPDVRILERAPTTRYPAAASPTGQLVIAEPVRVTQPLEEEVHEKSLVIIDVRDRAIVTVIEMLSPTNKVAGSIGRSLFLQKRREVYASEAHWMEIDLLRDGVRTANVAGVGDADYQVFLSRGGPPREAFVWPVRLPERLPVVGVPLRGDDPDVPIDLQAVLDAVVERGSYDLDADYSREPVPPLTPHRAEWAARLIGGAKG